MLGVSYLGALVKKMDTCLGAIVAAEETWRLLFCARCGLQLRLCPACDVGQRYCGQECSSRQRRQAQREASRAYQRTHRGRRLHATRMQRFRDVKRASQSKLSTPKVTQQLHCHQ